MIVVFDASAAVKLVLDEIDSDVARLVWDEADAVVAPTIMAVEVAAAVAAAARAGRVHADAVPTAHRALGDVVDAVDLRVVDVTLADAARGIAGGEPVRGMDAIYLAVLAELDEPAAPAALASFDAKQRAAALAAGLAILPAWTGAEREETSD